MADRNKDVLLPQIDDLIKEFEAFRGKSEHEDCSDVIDEVKAVEMVTRARAAIERVGRSGSPYQAQSAKIFREGAYQQRKLMWLVGVLRSMSLDIKAGYLKTLEELIHGEVFADFLDMALHLLDSGYKDAAAVVAGSTLEAHLRQLGKQAGLDLETTTPKGTRSKTADQLNSELTKASVYGKLDQKGVTAWLDLRNQAAHGHYGEYQKDQVALMVGGIRDFIIRNPA